MSFTVSVESLRAIAEVLAPFAKAKRLDNSVIPTTLFVVDGVLMVEVIPDLPRVTSVTSVVGPTEEDDGSLTLATDRLVDMCRRATKPVIFESDGTTVTAGPWQTPHIAATTRPSFEGLPSTQVDRDSFVTALDAVKAAASTDLIRPRLTIVHFGNGFARACDGMRYQEQRVDFDAEWDVSVFVAPLLKRYFESGHGELLHLQRSGTHQAYRSGGLLVITPSPMSEFQDLDELVAQPARAHNHFLLKTDKATLVTAVQDAAIMAGESGIVTLDVTSDDLRVSTTDGGLNRAEVVVPCSWSGDPRQLRFYITPFLQLLRTSSSEVIELRLGTSTLRQLTSVVVWEGGRFSLLNQVRSEA